MKRAVATYILLIFIAYSVVYAESTEIKTEHFVIRYEHVSPDLASVFSTQAEKAFSDVTSYLGKKYDRRIYLHISNAYDMPRTTRSGEILIPANRIRGDASGPPEIAGRGPAIAHEITHIIAPSSRKPNRYLDEGLAVFVQEKFGSDKSYPNIGKDVHAATAKLMKALGKTIPLDKAEETKEFGKSEPLRRLGYLEEGSFVRYLIEKYGLPAFMTMYEGKSYEIVYKKPQSELEAEWKSFLEALPVSEDDLHSKS